MTAWTVIILACLAPSVLAYTYCTAVHTELFVLIEDTQIVLGFMATDVEFDSPRPNYSSFRLTGLSHSIADPSLSFGQLSYFNIYNLVNISGIGASGLVLNSMVHFQVQVTVNGTSLALDLNKRTLLYQGTIYDFYTIGFPIPCVYEILSNGNVHLDTAISICCTRWRTVTPPPTTRTCKQLQSNATFINGYNQFAVVNITADIDNQGDVTFSNNNLFVPDMYINESLSADSRFNSMASTALSEKLNIFPSGSQIYLTTRIYNEDSSIGLYSSLGYFQYKQGLITGFNGQGLTEALPCVTQNLPYMPVKTNTKYTQVTSVSTICCTKFGDIEKINDVTEKEVKPLRK